MLVLFLAAIWAGVQNALAGGGSFITLPSLMLTGMDARAANITSTVALFPAQLVTGFTGRADAGVPAGLTMRRLFVISLVGGGLGALILLATPAAVFARLVPWLVLFATVLFAWGSFFRKVPAPGEAHLSPGGASVAQFFIALYGGYFGGGIGLLMMAALTMMGVRHAQRGRGEEHSRRRDQRFGCCDLRPFQGRSLAAGDRHRDRRFVRRLGGRLDAETRQREALEARRRRHRLALTIGLFWTAP